MTVTAATHSQVFATASAPKRLHYGEIGAYEQKQKAKGARAVELLEAAGGGSMHPRKKRIRSGIF
jgi:hypothetical protein